MDVLQLSYQHIISTLNKLAVKYEVHSFESGAIMIDIWREDKFYVFQFENNFIGLSEISENSGFDANPDEKFYDFETFKQRLDSIVK